MGNPTSLPTEKNQPSQSGLLYRRILLYGPRKVGKTVLSVNFTENPVILDAEGGSEQYDVFRVNVPDWTEFRKIGAELKKAIDAGKAPYSCIVVDTADEMARFCQEHVISSLAGRSNNLDTGEYHHPSDFEFGKGWSAVSEEFRLRMAKLCSLGLPVLFISHEREREVTERTGKHTVYSPDVGTSGIREWLTGFVDVILRATIVSSTEGERRVILAQPSVNNVVGGRTPEGAPALPAQIDLNGAALLEALSARAPLAEAKAA